MDKKVLVYLLSSMRSQKQVSTGWSSSDNERIEKTVMKEMKSQKIINEK